MKEVGGNYPQLLFQFRLFEMRQKIPVISFLMLFSVIFISVLYFYSERLTKRAGDFKRNIFSAPLELSKTVDIKFNSYYIAGVASNGIYLGNGTSPVSLLVINPLSSKINQVTIKNLNADSLRSGRVWVDSPYFYLADRISQTVFTGFVTDFRVLKIVHDSLASDLYIPISNNSLAIRIFRDHGLDYTLGKEWVSPHQVIVASNILEKKKDGIFSNDGMLDYDRISSKLVYIYYHQNQYLVLDTNLDLLLKKSTINSTSSSELKTEKIESERTLTLAEPWQIVNQSSYCFDNKLFIYSTLMARNEKRDSFKRSNVIDVYDLDKGSYTYSFYIPKYKGNKIKNFAVCNDYFAAIADHYLLLYKYALK